MSRRPTRLVKVGRREVELSNPDKVMYPDPGLTKADVAAYYERIADAMLPHVRDRPVSMRRYPDGIDGYGFVHKEVPDHYPGWIRRVEAPKESGSVTHALISEPATLVYLANQACITPHVWLSRRDRLERPDRLIFDLDPASDEDFTAVRATARTLGDLLERIGLSPFAMTTGSKGLHVVTPIQRRLGFREVRAFARDVARVLVDDDPDRLTLEQRKKNRGGRILVDVQRNGYAQTAVPPYALRARPGAPVATPLEWRELSDARLGPRRWNAGNVFRRLAAKGDPWKPIDSNAGSVPSARRKLKSVR